jgi:hypothetical protein
LNLEILELLIPDSMKLLNPNPKKLAEKLELKQELELLPAP